MACLVLPPSPPRPLGPFDKTEGERAASDHDRHRIASPALLASYPILFPLLFPHWVLPLITFFLLQLVFAHKTSPSGPSGLISSQNCQLPMFPVFNSPPPSAPAMPDSSLYKSCSCSHSSHKGKPMPDQPTSFPQTRGRLDADYAAYLSKAPDGMDKQADRERQGRSDCQLPRAASRDHRYARRAMSGA